MPHRQEPLRQDDTESPSLSLFTRSLMSGAWARKGTRPAVVQDADPRPQPTPHELAEALTVVFERGEAVERCLAESQQHRAELLRLVADLGRRLDAESAARVAAQEEAKARQKALDDAQTLSINELKAKNGATSAGAASLIVVVFKLVEQLFKGSP